MVSANEVNWENSFETGTQTGLFFKEFGKSSSFSRLRLYADPALALKISFAEDSESPGEFGARLRLRGWIDSYNRAAQTPFEYQLVDASLNVTKGWFRADVGFQQIGWGETFGVFIADLVNPRDLRDPLFNEISWLRVGQPAANFQVLTDLLNIQAVYIPVPLDPILPEAGSPFDPLTQNSATQLLSRRTFDARSWQRPFENGEGGGRVTGRLPVGLDLSGFFLTHWARSPAFRLEVNPAAAGGVELVPTRTRVHSMGMGAAQDFGAGWVGRLDVVGHVDQPAFEVAGIGQTPRVYVQAQSIVGVDFTSESEWTIGGQHHYQNDLPGGARHWASLRVSKPLLAHKVEIQAFAFAGLGNADLWLQPQVSYHPEPGFTLSLRADLAGAVGLNREGLFPRSTDLSRLLLWLAWKI